MKIRLPFEKKLVLKEAFELGLDLLFNQPHHESLKVQTAERAYRLGLFDQSISLLMEITLTSENTFLISTLRAKVCLAINTNASNLNALQSLILAKDHAPNEASLTDVLAQLGVVYVRMGLNQKAIRLFLNALESPLFNATAFSHWASLMFSAHHDNEVLERCDEYIARGLVNSLIFSNRYVALALLGKTAEAQYLSGITHYVVSKTVQEPSGEWRSKEDFFSALTAELSAHPALKHGRYDSAIKLGWRIDELLTNRSPVVSSLLKHLQTMIHHAISQLPTEPHPWLTTRPDDAMMTPWCLFTEQQEHATWHIHPDGWMSGVYYIKTPGAPKHSTDKAGCIEFGPPTLRHIQREIPGEHKLVRPYEGQLLLFPSHLYHRTYPTHKSEQRLVISFDIQRSLTGSQHSI